MGYPSTPNLLLTQARTLPRILACGRSNQKIVVTFSYTRLLLNPPGCPTATFPITFNSTTTQYRLVDTPLETIYEAANDMFSTAFSSRPVEPERKISSSSANTMLSALAADDASHNSSAPSTSTRTSPSASVSGESEVPSSGAPRTKKPSGLVRSQSDDTDGSNALVSAAEELELDAADRTVIEGDGDVIAPQKNDPKKRRKAQETLVIVRPPPASSKRPLNLQIQLVMSQPKRSRSRPQRSASESSNLSTATSTNTMYISDPETGYTHVGETDRQRPMLASTSSSSGSYAGLGVKRPPLSSAATGRTKETVSLLQSPSDSGAQPAFPILQSPSPVEAGDSTAAKRAVSTQCSGGSITIFNSSTPETERAPRSDSLLPNQESKSSLKPVAFAQAQDGRRTSSSSHSSESPAVTNEGMSLVKTPVKGKRHSCSSSIETSGSRRVCEPSTASPSSGSTSVTGISIDFESISGTSRPKKKRIIPLYNLSVHSVMTTNITDAGTDAKVAKFQKRSTEIVGVGHLEPTEIYWHDSASLVGGTSPLSAQSTRSEGLMQALGMGDSAGLKRSASTLRASIDLKSVSGMFSSGRQSTPTSPSFSQLPISVDTREPFFRTKKVMGNWFSKKKEPLPNSADNSGTTFTPGDNGNAQRPISAVSALSPRNSVFLPMGVPPASEANQLGPPTFGLSPAILSPLSNQPSPSRGGPRPKYSFAVTRWASEKGGSIGTGTGWAKKYRKSNPEDNPPIDEVTFEWVKANSRNRNSGNSSFIAERRLGPQKSALEGVETSRRSQVPSHLQVESAASSPRTSMDSSLRSPSPFRKRDRPTSAMSHHTLEDEESSDPEDSDTPWNCILHVPAYSRRRANSKTGRVSKLADGMIIATLYPAPHHPRVVAQIKVPMELVPVATGIARPLEEGANKDADEIVLSVENLKDVVCTTAMWLSVREGFAGLGKKKKV